MRCRQIVLSRRPADAADHDVFATVERDLPSLAAGEVLIRNRFVSVDPYMRGRLNAGRSYIDPIPVGGVIEAGSVGEVVRSRAPELPVGAVAVGMTGWQDLAVAPAHRLRRVAPELAPMSLHLGALGMPGITAWYGVRRLLAPAPGQTAVVSAAAGAVGSVAGQLLKAAGVRVIGIAGGPEKVAHVVDDLGFDACVDHRAATAAEQLREAAPDGVDLVFENVGGPLFPATLDALNPHARVALCGLVGSGYDRSASPLADLSPLMSARATVTAFVIADHLHVWRDAATELATRYRAGRLAVRETISDGLASAPDALRALFEGRNLGKQLVRIEP